MEYCTSLLDQVRTQKELSVMLSYCSDPEDSVNLEDEEVESLSLTRLKLAIKFSQKSVSYYRE